MYKLFLNNFNGQNSSAWENNWSNANINEALIYAAHNNSHKIDFDKFCLPGKRVIEAGCGVGGFVIYYAKRGCKVVGIDFAKKTVDFMKSSVKGIPVEYGSVEKIRYDDNCFDVYLSIGVMEHFEEGPDNILREAYRVLKPDGHLILTVPYINLSKKIKYEIDSFLRRLSNNDSLLKFDANCLYKEVEGFEKENYENFHQYEFTKKEVCNFLSKNKFDVLYTHGCSIAYGFNYIPFLGRFIYQPMQYIMSRKRNKRNAASNDQDSFQSKQVTFESIEIPSPGKRSFCKELLKDLIVRENTNNVLLCPLIKLLQHLCGDFLIAVCKPAK